MRFLFGIAAVAVCIASCSRNSYQTTMFYEDGRAKPAVAIASMLDTTSFDTPWSLSEELTGMIADSLSFTGDIVVHSLDDHPFTDNPFGNELAWMKRTFQGQEFVAFLELVEHAFVPVEQGNPEVSNNLEIAVRLRVVDLRSSSPKIVLQELIQNSYFVPKSLVPVDYSTVTYKTEAFAKSPMGIAHSILVQNIANRITDYVFLAKSR